MDMDTLAARFAPKDNPLRFRQGSIVSVQADQATLTVTIAGSTVPISGVRYATGVMPVPGLAVWLATDGRDLWAISTLMSTTTTPWGYYVDYTFARSATQPATPTGNIPASPPWYGQPPTGSTPLWMSEATKNPQGVVVGSWSLPVQLTGDAGPAGTPAPLVQIEYSQVATSPGTPATAPANWHTTPTGSDIYISMSNDSGATWCAAIRIVGPQGPSGGLTQQVFYAQPTAPYNVGDMWWDSGLLRTCITARATGSYTSSEWALYSVIAQIVAAGISMSAPLITGGTFKTAADGSDQLNFSSAFGGQMVYHASDYTANPGHLSGYVLFSSKGDGLHDSVLIRTAQTNGNTGRATLTLNGDAAGSSLDIGGAALKGVTDIAPLVPWTAAPAFTNSWSNYGSPYGAARYQKDAAGFVHLAGCISSGTMAAPAFTLPEGCRPATPLYIACMGNGVVGRLYVGIDGTVVPSSPATNVAVFLDGVSFPTT